MNQQSFGCNTSMHISPGTTGHGIVSSDLTQEDFDELNAELTRVEDEIQTLRQVLLAKEKYAMDIRRQLGTTPLNNIKHNLARGWQDVQTSAPYMTATSTLDDISNSNVYKRTQESLSYAGQVTTAALSTVGVSITRRLAEMRTLALPSSARLLWLVIRLQLLWGFIPVLCLGLSLCSLMSTHRPLGHSISVPAMRPSSTFKSFEEMVGSVKEKVAGGRGNGGNTSGFEKPSSRRSSRDGPF